VLPDLPGHGDNPARHSSFGIAKSERGIARDVLESAAARFHFKTHPAGVWGMSMGGAYAIEAAAEKPEQWDAVIVVSSFDALTPVINGEARQWFHAFAPVASFGVMEAVRWRAGYSPWKIRPVDEAASLRLPVMIVHGTADEVIALRRGKNLFEALPDAQRKRWIEVSDAHHGNVLVTPMPVFAEMGAWFIKWFNPSADPSQRVQVPGKADCI
jgi:pimeloyl-ACP methyl ester carboxylesterase